MGRERGWCIGISSSRRSAGDEGSLGFGVLAGMGCRSWKGQAGEMCWDGAGGPIGVLGGAPQSGQRLDDYLRILPGCLICDMPYPLSVKQAILACVPYIL